MIYVKTKSYDARYLYPINSLIYIKDHQFTTKPVNDNQKPFGHVIKSPLSTEDYYLEIEVYE